MKIFFAAAIIIFGSARTASAQATLTSFPATGDTNSTFTFTAMIDVLVSYTNVTANFSIDGSVIASNVAATQNPTDPSGSVCTYTTLSGLTAGTHAIHVDFIYEEMFDFGRADYSLFVSQAIATTSTTLALTGGDTYGTEADLTATVDGGTVPPSGLVLFTDGATALGVGALVAGSGSTSTAVFSTSTLAVGTHSLNAVFLGNGSFGGSQPAAPISLVVAQVTPTVTVSPAIADAAYLDPVSIMVHVTYSAPGTAPAPGTVTFSADPGTGPVALGGPVTLDVNGNATLTIASPLLPAIYMITASYNGTVDIAPGTGMQTLEIDSANTVTSLVSSSASVAAGASITLTASVVTTDGVPLTSGNVVFLNALDNSVLATTPVSASGVAQLAVTPPPGANNYYAVYQTNVVGAVAIAITSQSPSVSVTVGDSPTTVQIIPSEVTGLVDDDIGLTINLSAPAGVGQLTGTLVIYQDGHDIRELTVPNEGTLQNDGSLQFGTAVAVLAAGVHVFEAHLIDVSSGYLDTSGAAFVSLLKAGSDVVITTAATTDYGTALTVTANVAPDFTRPSVVRPARRPFALPTGNVQFAVDGVPYGAPQALPQFSSAVVLSFNLLSAGAHQITATYLGDANFTGSSDTEEQDIAQIASLTRVTSSNAPAAVGQGVLLTAAVTASEGLGVPSGSVSFFADGGTTAIGSAALDATGVALFTTDALAVGAHSIVATYAGDLNFTTSSSTALPQNVTTDGSVVSLSADPALVAFGSTTTLAAHVAKVNTSDTAPTGTITFADGGTSFGMSALDGAGNAQLTPTATLAVGKHLMTATYLGDTTHEGGSAQLSVVVYALPTTVTTTPQALPLIITTTLVDGDTHCPYGGVRVDIGLDNGNGGGTAQDGKLQSGEVTGSSYVCSPAPAAAATVQLTGGTAKGCHATDTGGCWLALVALGFGLARKLRRKKHLDLA